MCEFLDRVEARGVAKGMAEGMVQGAAEVRETVASDMLRAKEPLSKIAAYSRLPEDTIRSLAKALGIEVVIIGQ